MNLILLGLPGSGKGTHAKRLSKFFDLFHLSSGKLIRKVARQNTSLGTVAKRYITSGKLVPDEIAVKLIRKRIIKLKGENLIFDGFPRTLNQVNEMEKILEEIDSDIDICIYLKVKKSNLIDRLSGRRICSYDGCIYHVDFNPPEEEGICDQCGGVLHQREDDKEEVVKKRLKENENKTNEIKNYYQNKGILETVEGTGKSLNMVQEEINNIVKKYNK